MENWSNGAKLGYIITATLLGCVVMVAYMAWEEVPAQALVVQSPQALNKSVDIILRSRQRKDYYRLFDRAAIDSALAGAVLRTSSGMNMRSMQLSADTGRIPLSHGRWNVEHLPGIHVHAAMNVVANDSKTLGEDTVWLDLPGLSLLAERGDYAPYIVYASDYPLGTPTMAVFTHYQSLAEMKRARLPWLGLWVGAALLMVAIGIRALLKTFSVDGATWRRTLGLTHAASAQRPHASTRRHGKKVR